jgi:glycosyltransferase involved in cell wall biosynthesis
MSSIRISLITLGDPKRPTGGYLYHRRLAEAAASHGAELKFVSLPDELFLLSILSGRAVVFRAAAADVIVVDSIAAGFVGPWLDGVPAPVLGMLHQGPGGIDSGPMRTKLQAWLDKRAYRRMKALFVASRSLAEELRDMHPDIRVIAPGRDTVANTQPAIDDLRCGRNAAFLCIGNWIARKGIVELLDAFATLPANAGTLHLVGDDSIDRHYRAAVANRLHRLQGRVVVHGVVSRQKVGALYRAADVFVMPSYREPYGTVYGEAMAAGLPVVGWRAGNLPWLIDHGREGFTVPIGDVRALADTLLLLSSDLGLCADMGHAASARAAYLPTWEQTASRFFREVLSLM